MGIYLSFNLNIGIGGRPSELFKIKYFLFNDISTKT